MGTQNRSMVSSSNLVTLGTLWMSAVSADAARRGAWGTSPHYHRRHPFDRDHSTSSMDDHPLVELVHDVFSVPAYPGSLMRPQGSIFGESAPPSLRFDMSEDEDGTVELVMEVPGLTARDLNVDVENDHVLRVHGVRAQRKNGYLSKTEFNESIRLKDTVDVDRLKANLSAGILTITVPQKPTKVKKLPISSDDPGSILDGPPSRKKVHKKKISKKDESDFDDDENIEI